MSIVDPWKDPDPQPGDFDADLTATDPRYVVAHGGNPNAKLTVVRGVEGNDDAERLRQLGTRRNSAPPK